ncbi:polyketide synthase [Dictyobacter arantiisoli]|uniref:Putative polyketide biosynthesis enoyl-CoA isomerase PksI n=1 Tax=Dictyobacter arantiisoli TaxID=2014874 RepID=A0A5A5T802_9CHLR|nr:polyketide synthase [Dictyobacter arantiisoli]GCF07153.1 putative polyketide biosynthesis enoyl-CoA isomerase PksI [Dictyobacter arantiisoli]
MTQSVLDIHEVTPEIVQVTMQDRAHKNTFSRQLVDGLLQAFAAISTNQRYKCVVLTGYDGYFASGGTQESLLAIYEGREKFTDTSLYSLALDCQIPVIAAMQGHAIGGGFVMGLFADFVILGRECVYTTNFMKYGFTPGMGATFIVPQKLGLSLAEELLLNAGNYRGAELEKRGIPFTVLPKAEVLNHALDLAQQLAEKPRHSLCILKDHLVAPLRDQLARVIEQEVAMHEKTFHHQEVKQRISTLFGK